VAFGAGVDILVLDGGVHQADGRELALVARLHGILQVGIQLVTEAHRLSPGFEMRGKRLHNAFAGAAQT
jgi:hypothetical protein